MAGGVILVGLGVAAANELDEMAVELPRWWGKGLPRERHGRSNLPALASRVLYRWVGWPS